ncbi:MAG: winged helix-turn-helix transcriptional regulator, partial [Flavobacteriaceae bacterium]
IQTMEKKGFVSRAVSKDDMRINNVFITDKGKKVWETSLPYFRDIIRELQADIDEEDLQVAQDVLKKIQENINKKTSIK